MTSHGNMREIRIGRINLGFMAYFPKSKISDEVRKNSATLDGTFFVVAGIVWISPIFFAVIVSGLTCLLRKMDQ